MAEEEKVPDNKTVLREALQSLDVRGRKAPATDEVRAHATPLEVFIKSHLSKRDSGGRMGVWEGVCGGLGTH